MSWSNSMSTSTRKKASNSLRRINSSQSSVRAMSPRVRHWYLRSSPGLNLMRSEAHTSELQSPDHLVCRLLLDNTKKAGPCLVLNNEAHHTPEEASAWNNV